MDLEVSVGADGNTAVVSAGDVGTEMLSQALGRFTGPPCPEGSWARG